jgi:hypothetical protein
MEHTFSQPKLTEITLCINSKSLPFAFIVLSPLLLQSPPTSTVQAPSFLANAGVFLFGNPCRAWPQRDCGFCEGFNLPKLLWDRLRHGISHSQSVVICCC